MKRWWSFGYYLRAEHEAYWWTCCGTMGAFCDKILLSTPLTLSLRQNVGTHHDPRLLLSLRWLEPIAVGMLARS